MTDHLNNFIEISKERVTTGFENLKKFLTYFPFRKNPEEINNLTENDLYNPGYVDNKAYFFYWVEHKTRDLGRYSIGSSNVYMNALKDLTDFKLLLKRVVNNELPVHEKLDDKWDRISGFGGDRNIAKKILYLYHSDKIIPIWKTEDLIQFCSSLNLIKIDSEFKSGDIGRQFEILNKALFDFKNKIMPDKDNVYFSMLLYGFFDLYVNFYQSGKNDEFTKNIKEEILRRENTFNIIQYLFSKNELVRNYDDLEILWKLTISINRFTQAKKIELIQTLNLKDEEKNEINKFFNYNIGCWGQGKSTFVKYDANDDQKQDFFNGVKQILDLMINPKTELLEVDEKINLLVGNVYSKSVQSATITPLFHSVRPKDFGIINSTEGKVWSDLLRTLSKKERKEFSSKLNNYTELNQILKKVSSKLSISLNELDILVWNYKDLKEEILGKVLNVSQGIPDEDLDFNEEDSSKIRITKVEGKQILNFLKKNMKIF